MLLRGLKMPQPILERADIEATRAKANSSGRSHGGVPLRGDNNGGGRGGRINYADDRPNPFAAHINPNFAHPPNFGKAPPPPVHNRSYGPPPSMNDGYYHGPPPLQNGSYNGPPGYGRPPPPPQGYGGGFNNVPLGPPPYNYDQSANYHGIPQRGQYYRR